MVLWCALAMLVWRVVAPVDACSCYTNPGPTLGPEDYCIHEARLCKSNTTRSGCHASDLQSHDELKAKLSMCPVGACAQPTSTNINPVNSKEGIYSVRGTQVIAKASM